MKEYEKTKRETNLHRIKVKNQKQLGKYSKQTLLIYACYLINKASK